MRENGLWNAPLTTQDSSSVVTTICNFGGKGLKQMSVLPRNYLIKKLIQAKTNQGKVVCS